MDIRQVFGFRIKSKEASGEQIPAIVPPSVDTGATVVDAGVYQGGVYSFGLNIDVNGAFSEEELIRQYRELASYTEVSQAVDAICNEAVTVMSNYDTVFVNLDATKLPDSINKKISESFEEILHILNFESDCYDIFRNFYVDGKIRYNIILDPENPNSGIADLRFIDPRKIRKIIKQNKKRLSSGIDVIEKTEVFYIYNESGVTGDNPTGITLSADSVAEAESGLYQNNTTLSFLHKAIKPANQLKMLEDATVVYVISRAPERRVFYIDVGSLPKMKAEQYLSEMMSKFKNKLTYDAVTGNVSASRKTLAITEDYWLPRREGKTTEISTLPGGANMGQFVDNLEYFKKKLYNSLHVPVTRLQPENTFGLGRVSEITRDELSFQKFIYRLRARFNELFYSLLRVQLITKGIISDSDWTNLRRLIKFEYSKDSYFAELKETEMLNNRIALLGSVQSYAGEYFSKQWIKRNVLQMSENDIKDMQKEIDAEEPPKEEFNSQDTKPEENHEGNEQ